MIKVIGTTPIWPPCNYPEYHGYLQAEESSQFVMPYPDGTVSGDLFLSYIPSTCPTGFYGDPFYKENLLPVEASYQYRHLDGTEGTHEIYGYTGRRGFYRQ